MSPTRLSSSSSHDKRSVGIWIDPKVDTAIEHLKADTEVSKSELYELGARILLAVARARKIPDDLGEVLSAYDPEALDQLSQLIEKLKGIEG